jgi:hypothetical protein
MTATRLGVLLVAVLAACGREGSGGPAGDVSGTVTPVGGGTVPPASNALVVWVSDVGQGDFIYKWGEGTSAAEAFSIDVALPVPDQATFGGRLGVGLAVLIPSGMTIPDGVVADDAVIDTALGFSGEYAVIFRPNTSPFPEAAWVDAFPAGLSCGRCVPQETGFDTFTPVSCSEVKIQVGPRSAVFICNWT